MKITKIEKKPWMFPEIRRKRVAAYARVSTRTDEQLRSLFTQVRNYETLIRGNGEWIYAGVYYDEGVTGTSYDYREAFQRMMNDCEDGKIDMIITKSISRFARNTVDTIEAIRRLKSINVGVYFEKESIWTLDSAGEFILTLMAGYAQEEARSISENTAWGIRRKMEAGDYWVTYSRFLGYGAGFVIKEDEALIIRHIFKYALQGYSLSQIAKILEENGDRSPANSTHWQIGTLKSILRNEKYKGDALSQKGFVSDYLTKKRIVNRGQLPQYYVVEGHQPIIPPDLFDYVQERLDLPRRLNINKSGQTLMSNRIICGKCGQSYGPITVHSTDKYSHTQWQCRNRYRKGAFCHNTFFNEKELANLWADVFAAILKKYPRIKSYVRDVLLGLVEEGCRGQIIDEAISRFPWEGNTVVDMNEMAILVEYITISVDSVELQLFGGKKIQMTLGKDKYRKSGQWGKKKAGTVF